MGLKKRICSHSRGICVHPEGSGTFRRVPHRKAQKEESRESCNLLWFISHSHAA